MALGTWQVRRLHWKEGLIARAEAGLKAPPVDLPVEAAGPDGWRAVDFRRVRAAGAFAPGAAILVGTRAQGARFGGTLAAPLRLEGGRGVALVELGWAPEGSQLPAPALPAGRVELVGVARLRGEVPPGPFAIDPRPEAGRWFAWDLPAMGAALGAGELLPVTVALEAPLPGGPATPEPVAVDFPNNHLGYAITWYGLAASLAGVYLAWGIGRAKG